MDAILTVDNEVDRLANRVSSEEMEDDIDEAVDTQDAIRLTGLLLESPVG